LLLLFIIIIIIIILFTMRCYLHKLILMNDCDLLFVELGCICSSRCTITVIIIIIIIYCKWMYRVILIVIWFVNEAIFHYYVLVFYSFRLLLNMQMS